MYNALEREGQIVWPCSIVANTARRATRSEPVLHHNKHTEYSYANASHRPARRANADTPSRHGVMLERQSWRLCAARPAAIT